MDGVSLLGLDGASLVNGVTNDVHDSTEGFRSNGDTNGCAGIDDLLSSDESFSGVHGDGSHSGVAEMLGDFEDESVLDSLYFECVEDGGDFSLELHVDDGADHLRNLPLLESGSGETMPGGNAQATAEETAHQHQ